MKILRFQRLHQIQEVKLIQKNIKKHYFEYIFFRLPPKQIYNYVVMERSPFCVCSLLFRGFENAVQRTKSETKVNPPVNPPANASE